MLDHAFYVRPTSVIVLGSCVTGLAAVSQTLTLKGTFGAQPGLGFALEVLRVQHTSGGVALPCLRKCGLVQDESSCLGLT